MNALCSSAASVHIKSFKHYTFIGMCFLSPSRSSNTEFLLMETQQVLNRSTKCANVCYHKNQVFLKFIINSQSKLKKLARCSWDIYQEKLTTKFNKVSWWARWVGDPRNFHNSCFVKNWCLNLNVFSRAAPCSLNRRNRNS